MRTLFLGIDIGSTTVKVAVLDDSENASCAASDPETNNTAAPSAASSAQLVFSCYQRHNARQVECALELLERVRERFPEAKMRTTVTGSGGMVVAEALGVPFVQEVVANALAIERFYPQARCAIELGGQDAKMIFFTLDEAGNTTVSDMRMNGSCAGGTGAFLDEMTSVLGEELGQLELLANKGSRLYSISGRCGVYAKSDVQPLINRGVAKEDIALSVFHAVARQTIGGLAQGLTIEAPIVFAGGPLTFNPTLVKVFAERLDLTPDEIIVPNDAEVFIAIGAALAAMRHTPAEECLLPLDQASESLANASKIAQQLDTLSDDSAPFFTNDEELESFLQRHASPTLEGPKPTEDRTVRAWLGIDAGSTTTKLVLLDEEGKPFDSFYTSNKGEPLEILQKGLLELAAKYRDQGILLEILGSGATGYGEQMLCDALGCDYHCVETVAHGRAARAFLPEVDFVLDIGGQDMKAIWLKDGVITNILMNEACSSGCGSFLESFAESLGIPHEAIAEVAFSSESPAVLGSRCTVFMNSSIVSEQRRGKTPADIMAGLCSSIIENVFTKVLRISNTASLGENIVVQGGTFANDAVLAAFERYLGRTVTRAPFPGLMGAIGVALLTKEHAAETPHKNRVTSLESLAMLADVKEAVRHTYECPHCTNHCIVSRVTLPDGTVFTTGNRCERGMDLDESHNVRSASDALASASAEETPEGNEMHAKEAEEKPADLFALRERLLFKPWRYQLLVEPRNERVGLPRVLALWDTAPFWQVFFSALGFTPVFSEESSQALYESGLQEVASDTICFPAKLAHGHVHDLVEKGVDRIFMPIITTIPPEGASKRAESMCPVVKGYPLVVKASGYLEQVGDIAFDTPLFHWYSHADRDTQLTKYFRTTFGIAPKAVQGAIEQADAAMAEFHATLQEAGKRVMKRVKERGEWAVVVAGRPYHNDPIVHHGLPKMFLEQGISVLTVDSLPNLADVDLSKSRIDVVNNFHARMLAGSLVAARSEHLEYVQLVSFGCGHDAYLTDEIIRLMHETADAVPLVVKIDESDNTGALRLRVRSFIETINERNRTKQAATIKPLADPYPVKFTDKNKQEGMTVLVPNTSHAFSRVMAAVFATQGLNTVSLELGGEEAIALGKKYVHNDICFPAQMVIGEALDALMSGKYDPDNVCVGMGKYLGDCRLTHYSALLRKALDEAGFPQVPILTNDDMDDHHLHPGFVLNPLSALRIAFALPCIDILEELLRKIRPYEMVPGSADEAFEEAMDLIIEGVNNGIGAMNRAFRKSIDIMSRVEYDRSNLKPQVLIVGEYLLNFHPGANRHVEDYLERHGFEVIEARMTDVIRKTYFYKHAQAKEDHIDKPFAFKATQSLSDNAFELAHDNCERIAKHHPLYEKPPRLPDLAKLSDDIVPHTFDAGEGILIPAEILYHASHGCRSFLVLQPFGCLPNHIVGRGIMKSVKRLYPDARILTLDYDPDVSFANIENRLQMLVMQA